MPPFTNSIIHLLSVSASFSNYIENPSLQNRTQLIYFGGGGNWFIMVVGVVMAKLQDFPSLFNPNITIIRFLQMIRTVWGGCDEETLKKKTDKIPKCILHTIRQPLYCWNRVETLFCTKTWWAASNVPRPLHHVECNFETTVKSGFRA